MKRYDVIGEPTFDFVESKDGNVILYDDYVDFISARIKESEKQNKSSYSKYNHTEYLAIINALKNLLK
jgi:hypothetical protein